MGSSADVESPPPVPTLQLNYMTNHDPHDLHLPGWMSKVDAKLDAIVELVGDRSRSSRQPELAAAMRQGLTRKMSQTGRKLSGSSAMSDDAHAAATANQVRDELMAKRLSQRGNVSLSNWPSVQLQEPKPAQLCKEGDKDKDKDDGHDGKGSTDSGDVFGSDVSPPVRSSRRGAESDGPQRQDSRSSRKSGGNGFLARMDSLRKRYDWFSERSDTKCKLDMGSMKRMRSGSRNSELQKKLQKELSITRKFGGRSRLADCVTSPQFDFAVTIIIVLNALLIGAQVQHKAVTGNDESLFVYLEYLCTMIFCVELLVRLWVHRWRFFTHHREKWWNIFDFFLVTLSLVDTSLSFSSMVTTRTENSADGGLPSSGAFLGKLGRVIRMFRIVRIIRTVRFLSQLRVMMHLIVSSLQSLFWILVSLMGIIYIFAIVITQGANDYLESSTQSSTRSELLDLFGSLFSTMYTLYQCISGGMDWAVAAKTLRGPGWFLESIVGVFVFFIVFAVANIVNGVFVEGAIEHAKRDRMTLVQKRKAEDQAQETHLVSLLQAMDEDGDSMISYEEFRMSLENPEVRDFIAALEVEISDAKAIFSLLDEDGSGSVDIIEFVTGMLKLRGEAKSADIQIMLHENRKLMNLFDGLMNLLREQLILQEQPQRSKEAR